jgi:hypothetical protein
LDTGDRGDGGHHLGSVRFVAVFQRAVSTASGGRKRAANLLLLHGFVGTFFAYQTPGTAARLSEGRLWSNRREGLQERLLGFIIGGVNGYLVFGSAWYYLDATGYPFAPYITAPAPGSPSAAMVQSLPLIFLVQGNLLTILVIVLFLFVIVAMV